MSPSAILEFDLKKYDWSPGSLQDCADQASLAFQSQVSSEELEIIGSCQFQRTKIRSDEDLAGWLEAPAQDANPDTEVAKILRVTLPKRVLPMAFNPGEAPILARGKKLHAFDGEGQSDAKAVDFALRFYECGHFYMKQSYSSSHAADTPNWFVFEGRWNRTARGFRLQFLFRYPRPSHRSFDFTVHGLPGQSTSSLNFSGDEEETLKGFLPTMTGSESSCWSSLQRRADKSEALSKKAGEDDDEDEEEEAEDEEEEKFNQAQKTELVQGLMKELDQDQQRELRQVLGDQGLRPEMYSGLSPGLRNALHRLQRRATVSQRRRESAADGEPSWPMYLGLVLFVFVFVVFGYIWYEEHYANLGIEDIDEDAYWKVKEFM